MKYIAVVVLMFFVGYAASTEKRAVPDKLLECAALYGWAYQHESEKDRKEEYKEWVKVYTGYAIALSSDEYVFEKFKVYLQAVDFRIKENLKEAKQFILSESTRCSNFENLGEDVVKEINALLEKTKK